MISSQLSILQMDQIQHKYIDSESEGVKLHIAEIGTGHNQNL